MSANLRPPIWMPLYVSDYLAGTSHLSTEEHGAYLLLLMHAWVNDGGLPDDEERLRRIARLEPKSWRASREVLLAYFHQEGGCLHHHRVDTELQRARSLVEQRIEAGKASAAKRKATRDGQRNGNDCSTSVEQSLGREDQRDGNQPQPQSPIKPPSQPAPDTSTGDAPSSGNHAGAAPGLICKAMKEVGINAGPSDHRIIALCEQGVDIDTVRAACEEAKSAKQDKPIPMNYVISIINRWAKDAMGVAATGAKQPRKNGFSDDWMKTHEGIEMKAREMGIQAKTGEGYEALKQRIIHRLQQGFGAHDAA